VRLFKVIVPLVSETQFSEQSQENLEESLMNDLSMAYPEVNMRASLNNLPFESSYDCAKSVTGSQYSMAPTILSAIDNYQSN
jgi:hypothetical protein